VYRRLADDSSQFSINLHVAHFWQKNGIYLTLDFLLLFEYSVFSPVAIRALKRRHGWDNYEMVSAKHIPRRKLEEMLATDLFRPRIELTTDAGLSDSYRCKVLMYQR